MCNISNRRARGNHAKPRIEGSEFAQKRLQRRLTQPSLLWTRRVLEQLQAIQNQQGSTMRHQLRQSFALLPCRSDPWVWIAKPSQSGVKKFICGRRAPTGALSVEGPAKYEFCKTIILGSHPAEPSVNECGLPHTSRGNDRNNVDILVYPCTIQKSDILLSPEKIASCNGQSRYRNFLGC